METFALRRHYKRTTTIAVATAFAVVVFTLALAQSKSLQQESRRTQDASNSDAMLLRSNNTNNNNILIKQEERQLVKGKNQLRFAVFGAGNSWGAMLKDRFNAYPFLLSKEVDNYADFSAGPNWPAVCTQSMIGDEKFYDAIILDYWHKSHQGLDHLVRRLMTRFPSAIIVICKLWSPKSFRKKFANGTEIDIGQWKTSQGLDNNDGTAAATLEEVKQAFIADNNQNDGSEWIYPNYDRADKHYNMALDAAGGRALGFSFPMKETVSKTIVDYFGYFDSTYHAHVSDLGHQVIAAALRDMVINAVGGSHNVQSQVNSAQQGTWGNGDSCNLWFTTGGCKYVYSDNWKMVDYDFYRGKFAIEILEEGWIDVKNPFDDVRTVYLSYMATAENWYPNALIMFDSANGSKVAKELDTTTAQDPKHAHVTKTVPVGKVSHGTTRLRITPIQTMELPFRLVGITFTDEITVPLEYGFGPGFNK